MVPTWFGMCWPGHPFFIGAKVLREESASNRVEVSTSTAAVRFATQGLEEHFIKVAHFSAVHHALREALEQ